MARRPRLRPIKIEWKHLRKVWGYAYPKEHRIELDTRLGDKLLLDIAAHEVAHIVAPYLDEEAVDLLGRHIGNVLYRLNFRRVDQGEHEDG